MKACHLIALLCALSLGFTACQKSSDSSSAPNPQHDLGLPPFDPLKSEDERASEKFWIETGVGEKELRSQLNKNCYNDSTEFLSCVVGADSAVQLVNQHNRFVPIDYPSKSNYNITRVIETHGSIELIEVDVRKRNPDTSIKALYDRLVNERRLLHSTILDQYDRKNINFDDVATTILAMGRKKWGPNADAVTFRNFINSYLNVRDFVSRIEPYSYLQWRQAKAVSSSLSIGEATLINGTLVIKKSSSDAQSFGFTQGDQILSINGMYFSKIDLESLFSAAAEEATRSTSIIYEVKKLDGRIIRIEMPMNRPEHPAPIVDYRKIVHKGREYRLVKISTFDSDKVCSLLNQEILKDQSTQVAGYIIDLRGNSGGILSEGACVAGTFVGGDRTLMYRRGLNSSFTTEEKTVDHSRGLTDLKLGAKADKGRLNEPQSAPIVVLTNGESASMSESFAGVIREYNRGLILGQKTYGKGSVNVATWWDQATKKLLIWKTSAVYYLPSHKTLNRVGLVPDIKVPWRSGATPDEDFKATSEYSDSNPTKAENCPIEPKDPALVKRVEWCLDRQWILNEERSKFGTVEESDLPAYYGLESLRCLNELHR